MAMVSQKGVPKAIESGSLFRKKLEPLGAFRKPENLIKLMQFAQTGNFEISDKKIKKKNPNTNELETLDVKILYKKQVQQNFFIILPRMGNSLRDLHQKFSNKFSLKTTC